MNNSFRIKGSVAKLTLALAFSCCQLAPLQTFAGSGTAGELSFLPLPVSISVPAGWKVLSQAADTAMLVPDVAQPEIVLLVHAGIYQSFDPLWGKLNYTIEKELKISNARFIEQPTVINLNVKEAISTLIVGNTPDGETAGLSFRGVLSGSGLGVGVLALGPSEQIRQTLPVLNRILNSARFGMLTPDRAAMNSLIGSWLNEQITSFGDNPYAPSGGGFIHTSTTFTFNIDGTYRNRSVTKTSVGTGGISRETSTVKEESGLFYVVGGQLVMVNQNQGSNIVGAEIQGKHLWIDGMDYVRH